MVARRDSGGLQRQVARGGLAPLRGADGERGRSGADARGDGGREADQRPRGVHAGRRVHPRPVRGSRVLGRGRVLRPRACGSGRDGAAGGRVDRRGDTVARRLAHGLPPLRGGVPLPGVHPRPDGRGLRDLLRRQVPGPRARGGPSVAGLARLRASRRARRCLRREVRLGARELVRVERRRRRRVPAAARLGRAAVVARRRRRAPRLPGGCRHLRRVVVREDRRGRARSGRVPRVAVREPRRARRRRGHVHPDAQRARRDRMRFHGHAPRRGAVPDRHRDGVRSPRPRLDPRSTRPATGRFTSPT